MATKKTNVILTSYPRDDWSPTELKLGSWTDAQKKEFLAFVRGFNPFVDRFDYDCNCAFNVHVDDYVIHALRLSAPKTFRPIKSKNKKNEIIIEIVTDEEHRDCWPVCPATCSLCMQDGQCTSLFIKKYIGEVLFPNKYAKQK